MYQTILQILFLILGLVFQTRCIIAIRAKVKAAIRINCLFSVTFYLCSIFLMLLTPENRAILLSGGLDFNLFNVSLIICLTAILSYAFIFGSYWYRAGKIVKTKSTEV